MALTSKQGSPVGLYCAQYALMGSGFAYGSTGSSAANGTTMHAKRLAFPKNATLPAPQRVVTAITGGDRFLGQVMFGANEFGSFPLVLANWDADFAALATRSAADQTTNSRWTRTSDNIDETDLPQICLILTALYQSRAEDSDGENMYINYFIPRCQIAPQLPGQSYQAASDVTYTCTPTFTKHEPTGLALSGTAMNLKNDRTIAYAIVASKPLALTTFLGDASETDIVLGFKPSSTVVTLNAAANEMVKNGTPTALSSVTINTATAVLAAAGSAGDKIGILYETDFEAVA